MWDFLYEQNCRRSGKDLPQRSDIEGLPPIGYFLGSRYFKFSEVTQKQNTLLSNPEYERLRYCLESDGYISRSFEVSVTPGASTCFYLYLFRKRFSQSY